MSGVFQTKGHQDSGETKISGTKEGVSLHSPFFVVFRSDELERRLWVVGVLGKIFSRRGALLSRKWRVPRNNVLLVPTVHIETLTVTKRHSLTKHEKHYRGCTQTEPRPQPSQCLSMAHSQKLKGQWIMETIFLRSSISRPIPLARGK